jgi:rubrerythrin
MPNSAPGELAVKDRPLAELARDPSSRKRFLKLMGGGVGAASALSIFVAACGGGTDDSGTGAAGGGGNTGTASGGDTTAGTTGSDTTTSSMTSGDVEIVNYALTLEYLEADFYMKVIESGLFSGAQANLIKIIGDHEQQHVEALTATVEQLGGTPAEKPETKFPLESANAVLELAATVENLGAAAYLGQAAAIESEEILAAALSIHSVEARHASALNLLTGKGSTPDGAFAKPAAMDEVLAAVKPFIAS